LNAGQSALAVLPRIADGGKGECAQNAEKSGGCAESANKTLDQHEKSANELSGLVQISSPEKSDKIADYLVNAVCRDRQTCG